MPTVSLARRGRVAVLTVDNPPVNANSRAMRADLLACVEEATADPAIEAMVLRGAGPTFVAGADIREFRQAPVPPLLLDVIARIEAQAKPVIVALHGVALGGGLELALGCHVRVAAPGTRLGLPEVTLGIVPGAGGTQRLPRLVGLENALTMVVTGREVGVDEALAMGLVDEVVDGDLVEGAIARAERMLDEGAPVRRVAQLPAPAPDAVRFAEWLAKVAASKPGQPAPAAAVRAVRAATEEPFAEGMRIERALWTELGATPEARALQHVFFASRGVARLPGWAPTARARPIATVAVAGAGPLGAEVAMAAARGGLDVVLFDPAAASLEAAMLRIRESLERAVRQGQATDAERIARLGRIRTDTSAAALADADCVIEAAHDGPGAAFDDLWPAIEAAARPGTLLGTASAFRRLAAVATASSRADDIVGLHFYRPAHAMRLLEVVRAETTSEEAALTALKLGKLLGKVCVPIGPEPVWFVGKRMLDVHVREALILLEEGATAPQIDRAIRDFGLPVGPIARLGGGEALEGAIAERRRQAPLPQRRDGAPPDDAEIVERCILALANEAAWILDEGFVSRPAHIDMVWVHGFGFPAHRGGPLFHADAVGVGAVHEAVQRYADSGLAHWRPAPLLQRLADRNERFYSEPAPSARSDA